MTPPPLSNGVAAVSPDPVRSALLEALAPYREAHPLAEVEVNRHFEDALALRIVDPDFNGVALTDRNPLVRRFLGTAPDEARRALTYLLLLTPEETAEMSLSDLKFPPDSEGPVPFRRDEQVYRREFDGRTAFATVGKPWVNVSGDLWQSPLFAASVKFAVPPGVLDPDAVDSRHPAVVDIGETLRDDVAVMRFFPTAEAAREAAFAEAERRLARYAALHSGAATADVVGAAASKVPSLAAA